MAPYTGIPLSPAELSYLHSSLSQNPPIRPDGRSATTFRPVVAETDILPSANGSARICFSDGTEAIVGVKAEVEKSVRGGGGAGLRVQAQARLNTDDVAMGADDDDDEDGARGIGEESWIEVSIQIPDMRDDDALPVFLAAMLTEALLASGDVKDRLWINSRFHWRLYIDILLLSQPLSYPLPLLSLTTHLALLSTRLPALLSQGDEDPLFNDDWDASTYLFQRDPTTGKPLAKPPVTLLVMTVGSNILFDPSKEELAVADAVVAISAAAKEKTEEGQQEMRLVALRTIDPPSRLTAAGVPSSTATNTNAKAGGAAGGEETLSASEMLKKREKDAGATVWRPPRGGVSRGLMNAMIKAVVKKGGLAEEVLEGLAGVET
ncbi:Exosome complex component RRP42 [Cercospora zeina]